MDASQKTNTEWQGVLNFVNSFAANFNVNANCVRVAVIRYASTADVPITLTRYSDINSLQVGVRSLTLFLGSSNSNLATAFQILQSQVFASTFVRQGARLVAAIVTDKLSCTSAITTGAANVRNMGVVILGVGIQTTQLNFACLSQIVTPNQAVQVSAFSQLGSYVSQAVQFACVSQPAPAPAPAPSKYIVHEIYGKPFNSFCCDDF